MASNPTLQFKRGLSKNWAKYEGILLAGEPGFETDTGKLKIGNGIDKWADLPYVGDGGTASSVFNASTRFDFPSVGKADVIYKAQEERKIYQWNPDANVYELLGVEEPESTIDIELINGGNAYGTNS